MKRVLTCFALLILTITLAVSAGAATTVEIGTADALINLMGDASKWTADYAYVLTADIDLAGKTGQKPIGNNTTVFKGSFDGDGYTISGLNLNMSTTDYVGLFGKIGGGASISNLTVEGTVKGDQYVGGIVGSIGNGSAADTATITNCHNRCAVTGTFQVGGIVGYIRNSIQSDSTVREVVGCWNSGTVTANGETTGQKRADVGGIVGVIWHIGGIKNCWNTGTVTSVSGSNTGGIYGRSLGHASIEKCYTNGKVVSNAGNAAIGAFAGTVATGNSVKATFTNCYYNAKDHDSSSSLGSGDTTIKGFQNTAAIYAALGDAWEGISRPRLKAMTVKIKDEADLLNLMNTPSLWAANVVLTSNITLTAASSAQNPIGDSTTSTIGTFFTGTFDGGKHTISGINIVGARNNVGLFGVVEGGTIKDLTINGKITSTSYTNVGGLVGQIRANTVIENCTNNCTVSGPRVMGGIAGLITLTEDGSVVIKNSVNTGSVTANTTSTAKIGGLVGASNQPYGKLTIEKCSNSGNVTGTSYIGGIVGELVGSDTSSATTNYVITECYNSGVMTSTATGSAITGGIFGSLTKVGKVSDCWNTGNISCKAQKAGGFVGNTGTYINVTNCYVDCTVTCSTNAANVRAFCGFPAAKGFHSNYYNSAKCSVEATNTGDFTSAGGEIPTAYTQLLFDNLNANEVWIIASAPELAIFHVCDFTKGLYVDNGNGTHSRGCACGKAETGATSENHTFNDEGGCTKCDGVVELTEIRTAEDMLMLMKYTRLWAEGSFKLMNNIDLGDYTGTAYTQRPIGTTDAPFMGTFAGQDHTISGLDLDLDADHVGLFGAVGSGAEISNLTVAGSVKGKNYVGGIVGIIGGTSDTTGVAAKIINCTNECTVSGTGRVGGVVGYFNGDKSEDSVFSGCTNKGVVRATGAAVGGVAGILWDVATADQLTNTAAVGSDGSEVGGIIGRTAGTVNLINVENTGNISGTNSIGGIVGSVGNKDSGSTAVIKTAANTGSVSGMQLVGGVVGYFHGTGAEKSSLTDASNSGSITTRNETAADGAITGGDDIGGIAGILWAATGSELTNTGTVIGAGINIGGIVGRTAGTTTIEKANNAGVVKGTVSTYENAENKTVTVGGNYIGGIIGSVGNSKENVSSAATVTDCTNTADISARERVGGIVGYFRGNAETSELKDCTNSGAISTTKGNDVGGIAGIAWNIKEVSGCVNSGAVMSGAANAGGIVGRMTGTVTVTGCTNAGAVTTTGNDAGGIVGQIMNGELAVSENTNTAAVNGKNAVGGIVGDACTRTNTETTTFTDSIRIEKNVNNGAVTGEQYTAGIIGLIRDEGGFVKAMETGKTATLSQNNNTANVIGDRYVGGIVGAFRGGDTKESVTCSITECQNSGKVASVAETAGDNGADVGGIVGMLYAVGDVNNCVNLGDVETKLGWAGGFVGRTAIGTYITISNCFVSGTVTCSDADANWVRAFCGYPLVKNFHACYYDSSKCNVEATNVADYTAVGAEAPTAYATLLFDALNGEGKWVNMTIPELAVFHTVHDATKGGVDQGDGTHIPQCPCGEETGTAPVAHTYLGYTGICVCGAEVTIDPVITTAEQVLLLMNNANLWDGDYTLDAEIDLSTYNGALTQRPIGGTIEYPCGTVDVAFVGTFDGAGHKISGLNIVGEDKVGLFGIVGTGAIIGNLTVAGKVTGNQYVGGIAGIVGGTTDTTGVAAKITNCVNQCTVKGASRVGGIVGYFNGDATENAMLAACRNTGTVTATETTVGGIVGILWDVYVESVRNEGTVKGAKNEVGGIVGRTAGWVDMYWAENRGGVSGVQYVGGIVGSAGNLSGGSRTSIVTSKNSGAITADYQVGGIVGYFHGVDTESNSEVQSMVWICYNSGKITAKGNTDKTADVGGIVGTLWGADVRNCNATGGIVTSGSRAGGIIGRLHAYAQVKYCYANAKITEKVEGLTGIGAFCGNCGYAYGITACYYNEEKMATESAGNGTRPYTPDAFDSLNTVTPDGEAMWLDLPMPELVLYHTVHVYGKAADNGDGTHSAMCACGEPSPDTTAIAHTRDAYGICTLCGNADACKHPETELYVDGTPNCQTGAQQHTRCAICLVDIGTPTEIPADPDAHIAVWQENGTKQQYACTVTGCGLILKEIDTSSVTTLYVSKNGNGDGLTVTNPTGNFDAAMQLAAKVTTGTVTIYILDEVILPVASGAYSYYAYEEPAHTCDIVISGYGDTHAVFKFADVDMKMYYLLSGNTKFQNLEFSTWDNSSYMYIVGRHNKLIIGEYVSSDYHRVEGSGGAHSGNIYLVGGCVGTVFSDGCGTKGSYLEIHSGTFRTIAGGSYEGSCCTSGLIEIKFLGDVTARQQIYAGSYNSNVGDVKITIDGNVSAGTFFTFTSANASKKAENVTVTLESGSIFTGSFGNEALEIVPVGMCTEDAKNNKKLTDKLTSLTVYTDLNTQSAVVLRDMLYDTVHAMDGADAYGDKVQFLYIAENTYCSTNNGKHTPTGTGTAHPSAKPCIEQGYTEYTCSACTLTYKEPIALQSHALVQIAVTDATCMAPKMVKSSCSACHAIVYAVDTTGGVESQPDPTKHQLENGICRICKQDMTASCSHTYGAWENITSSCGSGQRRVCSTCTHVELNLVGTGHNYGKYTVTKEPTATMAGTKSRVCKSCGKVDTALINASGDAINAGALVTDASGNLANFDVESSKLSRVEKAALNALLQQDAYGSEVKISYETDGNTVTNLTYHIPVPAEYTEYKNVMVVVKDDNGELHFVDFEIEKGYIVFEF